jgi:integrase/recombinase XerD
MGLRLMKIWQDRQAHDPRFNAMDFRDGLMIAYLSLCPIRLENLAQMLIGRHLTFEATTIRVVFGPHETKGGKPLEFDFPTNLRERLNFYLCRTHPMLYPGSQLGAPMWPSLHNTQMTEHRENAGRAGKFSVTCVMRV